MPITMQQVLAEIDKDEPDYEALALLGPEALPHLQLIVEANDPLKSSKAVYAASLIGGAGAAEVLRKAADHHDPQVRIAVAQGLQNLSAAAPTDLVMKSLNDPDAGVRKLALITAGKLNRTDLKERVKAIAQGDPEEHLRKAASIAVKKLEAR